ncbi:hypothetical protein AB0N14_17855 [Streptomyces sp. NPDC051104]|uniref:hypothetical protein n=1 Tax=Streptomyces sp. NPDC051104 TaxID=3155044 RepID=UPI00342781C6
MSDPTPLCTVVYADGVRCDRTATRKARTRCSTCHDWSYRHGWADPNGRPRKRKNGELLAFLRAAVRADTDECVLVTGFEGRPSATYKGRGMWCARIVWIMAEGDPGDAHVLHTCHRGDEGCVNRRHLYLGNTQRNMADRDEAGRQARGSRQGNAVLEEADVRRIREMLASGLSQTAVAEQFPVSRRTISDIARGTRWAWLN